MHEEVCDSCGFNFICCVCTGICGMIGFHTAKNLCREGYEVVGFDNFNDYYDVNLKLSRHNILKEKGIKIEKDDILTTNYEKYKDINVILHLAIEQQAIQIYELKINPEISLTKQVLEYCWNKLPFGYMPQFIK